MAALDDHVTALFDFAMTRPEGFTRDEACADLEISEGTFRAAMKALRILISDGTTSIPCTPIPDGSQWRYKLVSNRADVEPWAKNRITDAESRLDTMTAIMKPIVAATDGRTKDGRIAREMYLTFRQLKERLEFLRETVA